MRPVTPTKAMAQRFAPADSTRAPRFLLALFPPTLTHTIGLSSATSDQRMDTAQHDSAKWWTRWRLTRNSSPADAQVALWKTAWLRDRTGLHYLVSLCALTAIFLLALLLV